MEEVCGQRQTYIRTLVKIKLWFVVESFRIKITSYNIKAQVLNQNQCVKLDNYWDYGTRVFKLEINVL